MSEMFKFFSVLDSVDTGSDHRPIVCDLAVGGETACADRRGWGRRTSELERAAGAGGVGAAEAGLVAVMCGPGATFLPE